MQELWREIPGYDRYEAEAYQGKVRSKNYRHSGKPKELKAFKMHPNGRCNKYLGINLWKDGKQGSVIPVHRIIALTFPEICGEYFEGAVVNHKDENPENNSAFNLEWCTVKYNNAYGTAKERGFETKVKSGLYSGLHSGTPEYREYWKIKNKEKLASMTEEEKRAYRDKVNERNREKRRLYRLEHPIHKLTDEEKRIKRIEKYHEKHPNAKYREWHLSEEEKALRRKEYLKRYREKHIEEIRKKDRERKRKKLGIEFPYIIE